jgi:hypothetical protein
MATDKPLNIAVTPKNPHRARATRWVMACILVLVGVFLTWRLSIWVITRVQIALVRKAGYPVSLAELNRWYEEVPANENAAVAYEKAFALLRLDAEAKALLESERTNLLARPVVLSAARKAEISGLLATNAEALKVLQQGSQGNKCRYSVDFAKDSDRTSPHLSGVKDGVQLLLLRAVLEQGEGSRDEAAQAIVAALDLSRSLVGEPDILSETIRVTSVERTLRVLELLLSQHRFSDAQLAALTARMHPEDFPLALERALAGERCNGIHAFGLSASGLFGQAAPAKIRIRMIFQRITGIWDQELRIYLSVMGQSVEAARWPFSQRIAKAKEMGERIAQKHDSDPGIVLLLGGHSIATMLLSTLERYHIRSGETQARLTAAQIVVAIERHRVREGGQLPIRLSDLVPKDLASIPTDPFDGKPFCYKRLEGGYIVYSVGADGVDNGGLKRDRSNHDAPYDVLFSIEARNQAR